MKENEMSLDELKSSYEEISKKVTALWKSGVKNKLNLAKEISNSYGLVMYVGDSKEGMKIHDEFLKGLPFGKTTIGKFRRIGSSEWLYEMDGSKLPNDYNTLESLAAEKVTNNPVVVKYLKENITPDISRDGVSKMVTTALNEEKARKNRSPYEPDPKKDGILAEYREDGDPLKKETSENGSADGSTKDGGTEGESSESGVKGTTIITIAIDKEVFGKNREVLMSLVNSMTTISDFVSGEFGKDSGVTVETKDKVIVSMLKKIESAETKARNAGYDDYSLRDLAA